MVVKKILILVLAAAILMGCSNKPCSVYHKTKSTKGGL